MSATSPLEVVPKLTLVTHAHIPKFVLYDFDIDMLQIPITGANLFLRSGNSSYALTYDSWMTSKRCKFTEAFTGVSPGANVTSWIGGAMEFMSSEGIPLAVFTDHPVTRSP